MARKYISFNWLEKIWYTPSDGGRYHFLWALFLSPLAKLTEIVSHRRYQNFLRRKKKSSSSTVPVILVGNITVGGTGKTPLVIALVNDLLRRGQKPGVISRGYGATLHQPRCVSADTSAVQVGDEPLLIFQQTQVPVVVFPQRTQALNFLLQQFPDVNVIVSDDGLQHYALDRDIEIVVVDGQRGWGNQRCLPAGPLRESLARLKDIDFLVVNGNSEKTFTEQQISMQLIFDGFYSVKTHQPVALASLKNKVCYAIAGIGNPQRFFDTLAAQGLSLKKALSFPDHYAYQRQDFTEFDKQLWLIMTEKDAVKCQSFALDNWVYLKIHAELPSAFYDAIYEKLHTHYSSALRL